MSLNEESNSTSIVIFGASGDLTVRKLVPALFNQYRKGRLPKDFHIVGTARSEISHEQFRKDMRRGVEELAQMECPEDEWMEFCQRLWYLQGDSKKSAAYAGLDGFLQEIEGRPANRLFYLATAPSLFPVIVQELGKSGMAREQENWRRIVIEKPFGRDQNTAIALNQAIHAVFDETQVYRIDHYLGKETAQNILYFRFLNTIFEPIWNRNYISNVQITVAETVDVEHRAGYYDKAGILRDMFQNHLLQLLTLVTMEPPATFAADAVRTEKVQVLQAIRSIPLEDTVRGQYDGYCEAEGVAENSQTPTYAALKLYIDNWRWQSVPFFFRSGKALPKKASEVIVEFKAPPHVMFPLPEGYTLTSNFISLCIQPDEGIHLRFETKVPDSQQETRSVEMDFHYRDSFGDGPLPDAYEPLLLDVLEGDASLFIRSDEIEAAWGIIDPILKAWEQTPAAPGLAQYGRGTWGPPEADAFIQRDGFEWRIGCSDSEN